MIQISHLQLSLQRRLILDDISFTIHEHECLGLIGPNGAGKTTLLKCLSGMIESDRGSITMSSRSIRQHQQSIGYLSQQTDFKPWMTCEQSLRFFGRLSGLDRATLNKRIPDVLNEVGLHDQQAEVIERLSGGMRQRLGIAQAILHEPIFLILDEPASALDPSGRHDINQLILRLKKRMTIIVSTHLLEDAKTCCDRFLVIKHGKLLGPLDNQRNVDQYRIQVETLTAAPSFSGTRFPRVEIDRINPCCYQFSAQQPLDLSQLAITLIQQGWSISSIAYQPIGLEERFLDMVADV
ncbi:ABC transporter ATP-binding protein [Exiguobacterium sp. s168]|uniref:ABC transporter ATP-binding protein n=1 Tax=Exiguobacterium sp. s168 TaxID=2751194 RepID=UPI001BEB65F0|nr:ABC transporter ATP-binding protein [Exiguobacterium sp. s168]